MELGYGAGMRVSELCGLARTDLLLEEGLVRVFGKGSKERLVPVGREVIGSGLGLSAPATRRTRSRQDARTACC